MTTRSIGIIRKHDVCVFFRHQRSALMRLLFFALKICFRSFGIFSAPPLSKHDDDFHPRRLSNIQVITSLASGQPRSWRMTVEVDKTRVYDAHIQMVRLVKYLVYFSSVFLSTPTIYLCNSPERNEVDLMSEYIKCTTKVVYNH